MNIVKPGLIQNQHHTSHVDLNITTIHVHSQEAADWLTENVDTDWQNEPSIGATIVMENRYAIYIIVALDRALGVTYP